MAQMQYFDPFPGNRGDELGNFASYRTQPHRGSDWGIKKAIGGKPIKAITNGRVKKIFRSEALGHCLVQSSGDGVNWLYAHLAAKPTVELNSLLVGGETVIGLCGGGKTRPSGTSSTGDHLHMAGAKGTLDVHQASFDKLVDVHKHIDANKAPVKDAA